MDALDQLVPPARELLARVDTVLASSGAPADHPIWPLLRKLRVLPSDAVAAVAAWQAAPLDDLGHRLRQAAQRYREARDTAPAHPGWEGAGAEAYAVQWRALRDHLAGPGAEPSRGYQADPDAGADHLAGRLLATARFADELAEWITRSRRDVAQALAEVLGSAEAVAVTTGGAGADTTAADTTTADTAAVGTTGVAVAAARIAVHVLRTVAAVYDEGQQRYEQWRPRLVELPFHAPAGDRPAGLGQTLRLLG